MRRGREGSYSYDNSSDYRYSRRRKEKNYSASVEYSANRRRAIKESRNNPARNSNVYYDEKRVPSRIAQEYTHFGWVRSKRQINEDLDRREQGIDLKWYDDDVITENIRRKKRFGYNYELNLLESQYIDRIMRRDRRGGGFLIFLGVLFLILCLACAVFTFFPKYPTTVAGYEGQSAVQKTINDIGLKIDKTLFYSKQYYVIDSEVEKVSGQNGTVVTVPGEITMAYCIDSNGQILGADLQTIKQKVKPNESGKISIQRVEKAYLDPNNKDTAYYRYYIYYETEGAPLGMLAKAVSTLPAPLNSGLIIFFAIFLLLAIIFFICGGAAIAAKRRYRAYNSDRILDRAKKIIEEMRKEDPSLMTKSQRHAATWQNLMKGAINMSGIARNDNADADFDEIDGDFGLF